MLQWGEEISPDASRTDVKLLLTESRTEPNAESSLSSRSLRLISSRRGRSSRSLPMSEDGEYADASTPVEWMFGIGIPILDTSKCYDSTLRI